MAYAAKRLTQFQATVAEVTYYTVTAGLTAIVKNIMVANTSASPVSLGISLVPFGTAAGVANRIVPDMPIPALSVVPYDLTQVLHTGDFISAKASVGGVIAVTISGLEGT